MKKRLQGLIIGVLIGALLTSGAVSAKHITETIDAVYMNIKLVVDGIEITPKDVNGNIVEPFIFNGTTYLPVRAIGEAFDKAVHWDGETTTVYVGDIVKPAKEVYLFDKPYLECSDSTKFICNDNEIIKSVNYANFIGFKFDEFEYGEKKHTTDSFVVYPLNGLAKKVKGTLMPPNGTYDSSACELQIKFYNENGKLLYQSPILNQSTAPIDFEFNCTNCLKLKIEFNGSIAYRYHSSYNMINSLRILTTDY